MEIPQETYWNLLPVEVKLYLFSEYFSIPELARLRLISQEFKNLSDHDTVWKSLFIKQIGPERIVHADDANLCWKDKLRNTGMYRWDKELKHMGHVILSDSNRTAQASGADWDSVLASPALKRVVNYCEIKVAGVDMESNTIRIAFGVTTDLTDEQIRIDLSWAPVGYCQREQLAISYEGGGSIKVAGTVCIDDPQLEYCGSGQTVGALLNREEKYVIFFKNRTPVATVTLHDLPESVFDFKTTNMHFFVSLISSNMVSLIQYCPTPNTSPEDSPKSFNIVWDPLSREYRSITKQWV